MAKKQQAESFKEKMVELQTLLTEMQAEELDVDAALMKYQRGQQLVTELEQYLQTAENKLTIHKLHNSEEMN